MARCKCWPELRAALQCDEQRDMQAGWEDLDLKSGKERKPLREFNMICFHLFGRRGCSQSLLGWREG